MEPNHFGQGQNSSFYAADGRLLITIAINLQEMCNNQYTLAKH